MESGKIELEFIDVFFLVLFLENQTERLFNMILKKNKCENKNDAKIVI
jgi:hypothetical protein